MLTFFTLQKELMKINEWGVRFSLLMTMYRTAKLPQMAVMIIREKTEFQKWTRGASIISSSSKSGQGEAARSSSASYMPGQDNNKTKHAADIVLNR